VEEFRFTTDDDAMILLRARVVRVLTMRHTTGVFHLTGLEFVDVDASVNQHAIAHLIDAAGSSTDA
jgi:hypothetical protein